MGRRRELARGGNRGRCNSATRCASRELPFAATLPRQHRPPRETILFCGVVSSVNPYQHWFFFHSLKISDTTSAARDNARKRRRVTGPPASRGSLSRPHAPASRAHRWQRRRASFSRRRRRLRRARHQGLTKMPGIRRRGEDEAGRRPSPRGRRGAHRRRPTSAAPSSHARADNPPYGIAFVGRPPGSDAPRAEGWAEPCPAGTGRTARPRPGTPLRHYGIERLGSPPLPQCQAPLASEPGRHS